MQYKIYKNALEYNKSFNEEIKLVKLNGANRYCDLLHACGIWFGDVGVST